MSDVTVRTTDGEDISVDDTVYAEHLYGEPVEGKVISISDPDGDYDDETLRPVAINPKVEVEFVNGDKEIFNTVAINVHWEDLDYEAEELYADKTLISSGESDS